jgi:hypothetical protein
MFKVRDMRANCSLLECATGCICCSFRFLFFVFCFLFLLFLMNYFNTFATQAHKHTSTYLFKLGSIDDTMMRNLLAWVIPLSPLNINNKKVSE